MPHRFADPQRGKGAAKHTLVPGPAAIIVYVTKMVAGNLKQAAKRIGANNVLWFDWRYRSSPTLAMLGKLYAAFPDAWDELDAAVLVSIRLYAKEARHGNTTRIHSRASGPDQEPTM